MDFKSKLSNLLFLQIEKDKVATILKTTVDEDIYIPLCADDIIKKVEKDENIENIPVSFFVEGMFFVLGADEKFKYNKIYKKIINNVSQSIEFIKGTIAQRIKEKKYEDAYVLLKGLRVIETTKEIYEKMILLLEGLKTSEKEYEDEELEIIREAKSIENYSMPYFYEAFIKRDKGDYDGALFSINTYISKGGEESAEVTDFKNSLKLVINYEEGKKIIYDEPENGIALLIPLIREMGDSAELYYYIAIGYRLLENNYKAIYYLEKSLQIDNYYPEVFNEMGINYACLEEFEKAVGYFRKVFEVTKSIEVCTNLIMCYLNMRDYKQAKLHLEIAKKIDPKDEIVLNLENLMKNQ